MRILRARLIKWEIDEDGKALSFYRLRPVNKYDMDEYGKFYVYELAPDFPVKLNEIILFEADRENSLAIPYLLFIRIR